MGRMQCQKIKSAKRLSLTVSVSKALPLQLKMRTNCNKLLNLCNYVTFHQQEIKFPANKLLHNPLSFTKNITEIVTISHLKRLCFDRVKRN